MRQVQSPTSCAHLSGPCSPSLSNTHAATNNTSSLFQCPIEMMSVSLDQSEPGIDFNFTMTIFGNVFTSSKESRGA